MAVHHVKLGTTPLNEQVRQGGNMPGNMPAGRGGYDFSFPRDAGCAAAPTKSKPLTDAECAWIERLKTATDTYWDELTDWEQAFMECFIERFRRYGDRTAISPKQWDIITRISEKIV
jgi:hypothetical protein